ncbi:MULTISPECIES: pyridoxamine 5'-phosphate oxidase family protein [unclassified Actinoplanes]|uniref:pyridoxamine 5'-phosphate oxidase family protein n=1 Tax=unclassified Actinoplanes TaxID=2626549 RepID=UPI0002E1CC56|nr:MULTISPECIES: pyridoxamine 5'-phosphate oxidase family protein [unclassified Actinoplanes]
MDDIREYARSLIATNLYLTLGTADADGLPWTSPVYFAPGDALHEFYWVSATDARHSLNLAVRPQASLVVFDSTVEPYRGRALYAEGTTAPATNLNHYPRSGARVSAEDVSGASPYRMYLLTATAMWVLCAREPGLPCALHGRAEDHRTPVPLG